MLDILEQELQAKLNELQKQKRDAEQASVRMNPQYSVSEMKSAVLAMTFTLAAIREAKKKIDAARK